MSKRPSQLVGMGIKCLSLGNEKVLRQNICSLNTGWICVFREVTLNLQQWEKRTQSTAYLSCSVAVGGRTPQRTLKRLTHICKHQKTCHDYQPQNEQRLPKLGEKEIRKIRLRNNKNTWLGPPEEWEASSVEDQ